MSEKSATANRNKNKSLLWLSVNCSYSHSSLVLPMLHSACRNIDGWDWQMLETTIEEDPGITLTEIAQIQPDLICSTLYLFNRDRVLDLLRRVSVLLPQCLIAVGGPECAGDEAQQIFNQYDFIHSVFQGEGENIFPAFLKDFSTAMPRAIRSAEPGNVWQEWIKQDPPVTDPFFRTDKPFVQMETSRGCPMACNYCTSCRSQVRYRSIEQVEQELSMLQKRGVRELRLLDRTFNFPPERGKQLLHLFRTKFPDMKFHLEIHPQFLPESLRQELDQALPGQLHLEAGIQSFDPQVQQQIGRKMDTVQALDGLQYLCRNKNFETHVDLLAGLPGQTLDSIFEDADTLIRTGPAEIQLEVLKILPGTPLKTQAESLNIQYSLNPPYDVMQTAQMSCNDILTARKLSRLLDLTYNHPALHPVITAAAEDQDNFLPIIFKHFLENGLELKRLFDLKKRFLILADLFSAPQWQTAQESMAIQWILCGYPPGAGPSFNVRTVNANQVPLPCGAESVWQERETRIWSLSTRRQKCYFAFNRKYQANLPAAVLFIPETA